MTGRIDCAFRSVVCGVPQLKTSAKGAPWLSFSMRCGEGTEAAFLQCSAFDDAEALAKQLAKGIAAYVEGTIRLNTWQTAAGEHKAGLGVNCRLVRVAQIGRNRPKRERQAEAPSADRRPDRYRDGYAAHAREFDDELPI